MPTCLSSAILRRLSSFFLRLDCLLASDSSSSLSLSPNSASACKSQRSFSRWAFVLSHELRPLRLFFTAHNHRLQLFTRRSFLQNCSLAQPCFLAEQAASLLCSAVRVFPTLCFSTLHVNSVLSACLQTVVTNTYTVIKSSAGCKQAHCRQTGIVEWCFAGSMCS